MDQSTDLLAPGRPHLHDPSTIDVFLAYRHLRIVLTSHFRRQWESVNRKGDAPRAGAIGRTSAAIGADLPQAGHTGHHLPAGLAKLPGVPQPREMPTAPGTVSSLQELFLKTFVLLG